MSGQANGQIAAFRPDRLREAAHAKFLTLPAVAREMGVAEKTVYRWNAGANPPRMDAVRRLAALLERDPEWFSEPERTAA